MDKKTLRLQAIVRKQMHEHSKRKAPRHVGRMALVNGKLQLVRFDKEKP